MINSDVTAKWLDLVKRLEFNTRSNKLVWKGSADENSIFVKVGENRIVLSRRYNGEHEGNDYFVEVHNPQGKVVDRFSDEMVMGAYPLLDKIFVAAYRQASGADAVLESIFSSLSAEPIVDDDIPF